MLKGKIRENMVNSKPFGLVLLKFLKFCKIILLSYRIWKMLAHRMCRGQNIFKFLGLSHRVFKFLGFESYLMSINHV
jgi:hypothetical protein